MKLQIHRGEAGLKEIETQWDQLFESLKTPVYTQSTIWHKAYIQHLCDNKEQCYYFCILKNNKLIAVFPLEQSLRRFFLIKLNALCFSQHDHFGINSVIVEEDENIENIFDFLYNSLKKDNSIKWSLIYLERTLQDTQAAHSKITDTPLSLQSASSTCNTIPIQGYEKTLQNLSKNFKKNLKKARKNLSQIENINVKTSRQTEVLDQLYEDFVKLEASGWKGTTGKKSAIKLDPQLNAFYKQVMHGFSLKQQMEINLLCADDTAIAGQFSIILAPTVFPLKIAYDEKSARLSPGLMLKELTLKAYEKNPALKTMNLISDAQWHSHWKPIVLQSKNLYHCRNSFIALYIKTALSLRSLLRMVKSKLQK